MIKHPVTSTETSSDRDEGGYVMIMTALLLIPLLVFAAFAVDVGAWYAQAARTQRAADAAALAAVVWMPDEPRATEAALDVAARNGFVHGTNATITVERVGAQQVRVRIESEGEVYFGAPVMDSIQIERFSIAEYILPVPMGNPGSALGTGNLPGGDGVWLSVNGICQARAQGDPFSARYINTAANTTCNASGGYDGTENLNYNEDGYTFVVDVPEGAGEIRVQIYEPGLCPGTAADDYGTAGPRMNFRLYANDDTPLSDQDNLERPPVSSINFDRTDCTGGISGDPHWYQAFTIPAGNPGRWFVRARGLSHEVTGDNSDRVAGLNTFAIRLARGVNTATCSSLSNPACPQIYAKDYLSVYRPGFGSSGTPAIFYLAEIAQNHAGKKVEIQLFDAGEGMDNIQILGPSGNALDFEWQFYTCGMLNTNCPDTGLTGADSCSGNPCLQTTDASGNRFQDKSARIVIDLPANYDCEGQSICWWRLRYQPSSTTTPTDRTTWSVRVIGDPVRLTE